MWRGARVARSATRELLVRHSPASSGAAMAFAATGAVALRLCTALLCRALAPLAAQPLELKMLVPRVI